MSLSTDPYKGTRDFYPDDMAIERYIFDTWAKTAELFGYERYDASVLEPALLYKSKGAENEELVNEQTYTFTDRGDREVTLRPEMTPTVARMVAGRRRELSFPLRWYSIPNLFRYERPQRGRLREHWQLNCDLFGSTDRAADIELIELASNVLLAFGATPDMFRVRVNDRGALNTFLREHGIVRDEDVGRVTNVIDRKAKVSPEEFDRLLTEAAGRTLTLPEVAPESVARIIDGLAALGVTNVEYDPSIVRGFSYYTGTVFEIFDVSGENNRALLGGGRYDNLTELFGDEPIPGIGFGMGDVTMRDFLETHDLIPPSIRVTAPTLIVIPTDATQNEHALRVAQTFRSYRITTSVDLSDRKIGKKVGTASDRGATYVIVVGPHEVQTNHYTLKDLRTEEERMGTPEALAAQA